MPKRRVNGAFLEPEVAKLELVAEKLSLTEKRSISLGEVLRRALLQFFEFHPSHH